MTRLFVDPGTKSVGVAYYDKRKLVASFTVLGGDSKSSFIRQLNIVDGIFKNLEQLGVDYVDEAHLEQLVRTTHIMVHWSVGSIGTALAGVARKVEADIPIQSWKFYSRTAEGEKLMKKATKKVQSDDELCAILFGAYYVNSIKPEDL